MDAASKLTLLASGIFFLTGLLTGVWKYMSTVRSARHAAPRYVNVAHQASLLYAFAALLLLKFLEFSPYSETVNLLAAGLPIFFFMAATATYISHGVLRDTEDQFQEPYGFGKTRLPPPVFHLFVWLLIVGEVGGFLVLFVGYLNTQVLK
jgi:hypothetical protein